jgi:hypothetical protein
LGNGYANRVKVKSKKTAKGLHDGMYFKYYPSLSIVENLSSLLSGKNRFNGCALLRPVATLTDYKLANSLYRHKKNVETPPPLLKKEKKKL